MDTLKFTIALTVLAASSSLSAIAATPSASAAPAAITRCVTDTTILQGGFAVKRCYDGKSVGGVGTTLDAAVANANSMATLISANTRCNYSSLAGGPGAFIVSFGCDTGDSSPRARGIGGLGTYMTDAGVNAFGVARLLAATGYICNVSTTTIVLGGYVSNFGCGYPQEGIPRATTITGVGSTATDAAANTLGFAELGAAGFICKTSGSSIRLNGLAYEVRFTCTGRSITGIGSTLTSAGRDALLQASAL
ncbi:hypothetical protein [Pseudoxanthomonas indica]|uniref:Uncharacterized protein n=1 Tax=Pseudoxanthomonas indica TaxID=428993 RepID=A0A1T5JUD2_9GAMM|nr:hypothetical protein [Pseudoxanthomonas indica]SKC54889.1 hypothetical protein SAMN06296058_1085 [Pseudoxanthomonas indica]